MKQIDEIFSKFGLKRVEKYCQSDIEEDFALIKRNLDTGWYTQQDARVRFVEMAFGNSEKTFVVDKTKMGVPAGDIIGDLPLKVDLMSLLTGVIIAEEPDLEFGFYTDEVEVLVREKVQQIKSGEIENKQLLLKLLFNEEQTVNDLAHQIEDALTHEATQLNEAPLSGKLIDKLHRAMKKEYNEYVKSMEVNG